MAVFYKRDERVYCTVRTASLHRIQFTFVLKGICIYCVVSLVFSPLKTKRRLHYLKTQFVPRNKHFSSGYKNQSIYAVSGTSRCLFSNKYKTHKYSVGRTYSCWMLNCWCIAWPVGFKRLSFEAGEFLKFYLLSYDTVYSGRRLATFRINHNDAKLCKNLPDCTVSSRSRRQQIF